MSAKQQRIKRAVLRDKGAPSHAHGRNGYDNYGCRCPKCREAKSIANAEYRMGVRRGRDSY